MSVVNVHKHIEIKGTLLLGKASSVINTASPKYFENALKFLGWEKWPKNQKKEKPR